MNRLCPKCGEKFQEHVVKCEQCGTRLVALSTQEDRLIGQSIDGRFTITDLIARGGMGSVYRAYQSSLDRHIAVKVLHPAISESEEFIKRFFREATAVSSLDHHHITQVHDFGQTDDGLLYMMMEYLEGPLLYEIIALGPIPPARTVNILGQVCDALSAAHEAGIVHRDLKPENIILLDRAGAPDFVKVLDFGLAIMSGSHAHENEPHITQAHQFVGTPQYMSPEQFRGHDLSPRSDLYSLGIILYEMLVGSLPFSGTTPVSLMMKHAKEAPPSLAKACKDFALPPELDDLYQRLVYKEPGGRPSCAEEVKALLFAAFDMEPGPGYRRSIRATRNLRAVSVDLAADRPTVALRPQGGTASALLTGAPEEGEELMELVIHEIKTPLTVVSSGVDLLASGSMGELTPQQEQFFHLIKRNIQRLSHFSADVLNLSRINADKYPINPREMSLDRVLKATTLKLHQELLHRERPATIHHDSGEDLRVFGDPEAVSVVITGLLRVLLMAFSESTGVAVMCRRRGPHFVEITLGDATGAFTHDDLMEAMNSLVSRTHGTLRGQRGLGIRLGVCRSLVEKMGGRLTTISSVKNAAFRFTLPTPQAARLTLFGQIARMLELATPEQIKAAATFQRSQTRRRRPLGELLMELGAMSEYSVEEVLRVQEDHLAHPHPRLPGKMDQRLFGRVALKYDCLDEEALNLCLARQQDAREEGQELRLGQVMVQEGFLEPPQVIKLLAIHQLTFARCGSCGRRYNLPRPQEPAKILCPGCQIPLAPEESPREIAVEATLFPTPGE